MLRGARVFLSSPGLTAAVLLRGLVVASQPVRRLSRQTAGQPKRSEAAIVSREGRVRCAPTTRTQFARCVQESADWPPLAGVARRIAPRS